MSNPRHKHRKPSEALPRFTPTTTKFEHGERVRVLARKGTLNRHIIAQGQTNLYEYSLHATKGYRARSLRGVET